MITAFRPNHSAMIRQFGRSIQTVFPRVGQSGHPFAYSIGNTLVGKPELIVVGFTGQISGTLINTVSEILRPDEFVDGILDIDWNLPFWLLEQGSVVKEQYTVQAGQYLRRDYRVMQIVFPDVKGRFPWQEGCDPLIVARQKIQ